MVQSDPIQPDFKIAYSSSQKVCIPYFSVRKGIRNKYAFVFLFSIYFSFVQNK